MDKLGRDYSNEQCTNRQTEAGPSNQEKLRVKLMGTTPCTHCWRHPRLWARFSENPESLRRLGHGSWSLG